MSTNFYWKSPTDKAVDDDNHIGLSAGGALMLQAHPAQGILSLKSLMAYLDAFGLQIVDEYGNEWSKECFLVLAQSYQDEPRSVQYRNSPPLEDSEVPAQGQRYVDPEGHLLLNAEFC